MARYLLADFVVELKNQYDFLTKQCTQYLYTGERDTDISVEVSDEELRQERNFLPENQYSAGYLESICAYRKLCLALPLRDAMLLHGSVIRCKDRGIAFLARSGVGKTTHTMLWKQVYGDAVQVINGDKPIIRFFDDAPYAYGTPWAGKEKMQTNTRVPLTDICLIQRSEENAVIPADPQAVLGSIFQQVLLPDDPDAAGRTLELLDLMLANCRMWIIRCNISQDAAILAHDTIIGGLL